MEKKQMVLTVVVLENKELRIIPGDRANLLDATMLFLALCRTALVRRAELGQSMEQDDSYHKIPCPDPFELMMGTKSKWAFRSGSCQIWRELTGPGYECHISGQDARMIVEATAQDLGAELKIIEPPKSASRRLAQENDRSCPHCEKRRGPDVC